MMCSFCNRTIDRKKRSTSSRNWLIRNIKDQYVKKAFKEKLRSRAWFKIAELQKHENFLRPGTTVIDLGSSPGSWSEYAIKKTGRQGRVISCDIMPMKPIPGVYFIQGNLFDELTIEKLSYFSMKKKVQVVMSDMAPIICGKPEIDIPRAMQLSILALKICKNMLSSGGTFVTKVFHGDEFKKYLEYVSSLFLKVKIRKPKSSRAKSREVYIVATGKK